MTSQRQARLPLIARRYVRSDGQTIAADPVVPVHLVEPGVVLSGAVASWSHRIAFAATPVSALGARAFVTHHLVDHRLLYLVDPVRLVARELAANAWVRGQTGFVVTLSGAGHAVRLTVGDDSDWVPSRGSSQVLAARVRGPGVTSILSSDWGVITAGDSMAVWALFDVRQGKSS